MSLTPAQLLTLKNDITTKAQPGGPFEGKDPANSDDASFIADYYNQLSSSPAFIVWRTSVSQDEIMLNGFDWARVDNLSVGKARIWEWLFNNANRAINPSKLNIRNGIDATWVGTVADLAVRAAVYVHCKRTATRVEQLLAVGGAGNEGSPSTMTHEGSIDYLTVLDAAAAA